MFDWNDPDQVGDTIWGDFSGSEDHIVPYPKRSGEDTLFTFGECNKKQKLEEVSTVVRSVEQRRGDKIEFCERDLESNSNFIRNEEISNSRLEMDIWPELPSLNTALNDDGYTLQSEGTSLATNLMRESNEASETPELGGSTVQLHGESQIFAGQHEDKEIDNFLDCDWATIGDFDDLDRIFRNSDSLFDHEMVGSAEEFLSPATDVIGGATQSIPEISGSEQKASDQSASQIFFENNDERKDPERKPTEVQNEQSDHQSHLSAEYSGMSSLSSERLDGQKKLLKSRKKAEERIKNRGADNTKGSWPTNINIPRQVPSPKFHSSLSSPIQAFQSPTISQQSQVTHAVPVGNPGSSRHVMFSGYGYPHYAYTTIAHLPHGQTEWNKRKLVSVGHTTHQDSPKHSESANKLSDIAKTLSMTPQEKIEKLRWRHQIQAMMAIQQQRQQLGHQISRADSLVSQGGLKKNQSQDAMASTSGCDENSNKIASTELNILEHDDLQLRNDNALAQTIYYQLQDALEKLDIKLRLRMRDSLFRLARSATERQNASDRSSTNISNRDDDEIAVNEEIRHKDRSLKQKAVETHTNLIDRTVAHLLFHRPDSCLRNVKDEIPNSPISSNPVSKPYINASGSVSEEQPQQ